jgi:glycosyltransferase involved in cell wall biosynthesis
MTDGSLFFSNAKKNYFIIQSPSHIPKLSFKNKLKLSRWKIICYSQFMKNIIHEKIQKAPIILSPCVDNELLQSNFIQKENIILNVGRFFSRLHSKKQEVLVKLFIDNFERYFLGWKLIIAGGLTQKDGLKSVKKIKESIKDYPIEIILNPPFKTLKKLYSKAKIYWHAAGFGEDEKIHPERMEHFGITTVEAMAAGSVPIVYKAGGQKDIVSHMHNGLFWENEDGLITQTAKLIKNKEMLNQLSKNAMLRARDFSCKKFYEEVDKFISN